MNAMTIRNNRSAAPFNPFRQMEELERTFFGEPMGSFFSTAALGDFRTDVTDEGDHYLLEADLPGFEKKDIRLELQDETLTVRAERHSKVEQKNRKNKVICMERSYGSYSRSFDISGVETDGIKAKYENGVLRMTLPKKEDRIPRARQLEIE